MSMSRIYLGIFGQDEQVATDAFAEFVEVSSGEVGSTDASLEEHVSTKEAILLTAIIYHASGRVSRYVESFEFDVSEANLVAVADVSA